MIILLIILLLISLWGIKYNKEGNDLYIEPKNILSIKGIFVFLILLSHFKQYIELDESLGSNISIYIFKHLGQLIVTIFFFYSGYGIFKSITNKKDYIKDFPKKRIFKTLLHFDIAVLIYFLVNLILHNYYSVTKILLSFTGYESIGNSNWFIFTTIFLYLFTYISYKLFKKNNLEIIFILCLIYIFAMRYVRPNYWFDTVMCYPFGMLYAMKEKEIKKYFTNNYLMSLLLTGITFLTFHLYRKNIIIYELHSITFCLLIVLISYKFTIKNKLLDYLGKNVFTIYIMQRIAYMLLQQFNLPILIYFFISMILLVLIMFIFDKLLGLIDKIIKV